MVFTIKRPNGKLETVRHIPYAVVKTGHSEWTAYRKLGGKILGRSRVSESHLRYHCDTCTEPVQG